MSMRPFELRRVEFHALLALAEGPLYGYVLQQNMEAESQGVLRLGAGSLYRILARLIRWDLIVETDPPADEEAHPGKARRYYALTAVGRRALLQEAQRLLAASSLAASRLELLEEP